MHHIVSALQSPISEPAYLDFRDSLSALVPPDGDYQISGAWIDLRELGFDQDPENENPLGAGQFVLQGSQPLPEENVNNMRGLCEALDATFLHHPFGAFQGNARTAEGQPVWIEGFAAELFGGNVFDQAFEGHTASLVFLRRTMSFASPQTAQLLSDAISNSNLRGKARKRLEAESKISFADDQLYYGKNEEGLGNVYSVMEITMLPNTSEESGL